MTIEEVIQKAIEGGLGEKIGEKIIKGSIYTFKERIVEEKLFLDRDFWQCLGKAMGWEIVESSYPDKDISRPFMGGILVYPYYEGADITYAVDGWKYYWLKFIEHLAEGKTIQEYFNNL